MGRVSTVRSKRKAKGRDADSPTEVPARGWREVVVRAGKEAWRNNIALAAAGTAFYGMVAIVPITLVCLIVYSAIADPAHILRNLERLQDVLPQPAIDAIQRQLDRVIQASARSRGLGAIGAMAVALFGARNAATALIAALNIAYGEKEQRDFMHLSIVAVALMAAGFALSFVVLIILAAIGGASAILPDAESFAGRLLQLFGVVLIAGIGAFGAAALYRFAPCRATPKWRWSAPGSLIAAALWIAVTTVFALYATTFGRFGATYGPAAGPIVLLIWLYLSALAFLIGAQINAELEKQTAEDTTEGRDKPRGKRGAKAADKVAGKA